MAKGLLVSKPTEVWVLEVGCYSDRYVAAVFSSREEAHRQLTNRGLVHFPEAGDPGVIGDGSPAEGEIWGSPGKQPDWDQLHELRMTQLDDFWREERVEVTLRQEDGVPPC